MRVANRSSDFNYKVALASGLKSLQGGRLRAAEEQFRYLVKNFPTAEGGYRGLAKVLLEQEDRLGALKVLVDGGAALAKADQRALAIQLYKEATTLAPVDLTAHRRLAAAYMLAGDNDEAAHEFVRYIANAIGANDTERAKLEAAYALERLPGKDELTEVATTLGIDVPAAPPPKAKLPEVMGEVQSIDQLPQSTAAPRDQLPQRTPRATSRDMTPPPSAHEMTPPPSTWTPAPPARDMWDQPSTTTNDAWAEVKMPSEGDAPTVEADADGKTVATVSEDADAQTVEATAAQYLASGDQRAGQAAVEAARRYIAEGRMDAASDLLLQLIASGVARHEAQRLLVDVTKRMGKSELTQTKLRLLVEALRLDGREELAAEVEQAAQAE